MSDVFVDVDWLRANLDDPRLRIVDARNVPHGGTVVMPSGLEQYHGGHLPNAIYLDYAHELADPQTPYAIRVAPAEAFARALNAKGIGDDAIVVAYDDGTIPFAARIVWMLHYYGHDTAFILAGGLRAWLEVGGTLTQDVPEFSASTFTPHPRPELRATRDEVLAISDGRLDEQLLETQRDTTYAQRDHDIKGAIRLSASRLLEDANGGRIAAPETLRELIAHASLDPDKRTVVSCGSGVSAAGSYFALKAAGFRDLAVYDGSWMEWNHDGLPIVPKAPIST
jgi:thiosulfate/3-mercaptopyruvate sulfurtransferase